METTIAILVIVGFIGFTIFGDISIKELILGLLSWNIVIIILAITFYFLEITCIYIINLLTAIIGGI